MTGPEPSDVARERGPLSPRLFRVLVYEADARISHRDFDRREDAVRYADDAASETESGVVSSWVFDERFALVYTGKHY